MSSTLNWRESEITVRANVCATVAILPGFNLIPGSLFQPEGVVNTLGRLCRTCIFTRFLRGGAL